MKTFNKILALVLVAGSVAGLTACSSTTNYKTATSANWNERVVSDSSLSTSAWKDYKEVATYSISFEKGTGADFAVDYVTDGSKPAEYKTEFYVTEYNWNDSNIPSDLRSDTKEYVYVYKTTLTISGKYTLTSKLSSSEYKDFDDSVERISYFRSAEDNLQPVYTKQVIKSTAPANFVVNTIESAYIQVDATYETFYSKDCSTAVIKTTDNLTPANSGEKTVALGNSYSVFDSAYLDTAMRAFTKTESSSYTFDTLIAINGATSSYKASVATTTALNAETESDKAIIDALDNSTPSEYIFVGTDSEGKKTYNYNAVTLTLNENMPGPSSVYYYATVASNAFNTTRSVLLKISSPLYYNLGTLTYSLSSLSYEAINAPTSIPED
jgi:hypothetical protein